jgi:endonuclease III
MNQKIKSEKRKWAIEIIGILRNATKNMPLPMSEVIAHEYGNDPYLILISCLLSLRNKDTSTLPVSRRLFSIAKTPGDILSLTIPKLEKIIYSIGFYRNKAQIIHSVSQEILDRFNGQVPKNRADLLSIKGIGPKTANLVLGMAFDVPAICVDVHVHRISNRIGLIKTTTVEETEIALMEILPKKYWVEWNKLLVVWGQNICTPVSPWCSRCPIYSLCRRNGVFKKR